MLLKFPKKYQSSFSKQKVVVFNQPNWILGRYFNISYLLFLSTFVGGCLISSRLCDLSEAIWPARVVWSARGYLISPRLWHKYNTLLSLPNFFIVTNKWKYFWKMSLCSAYELDFGIFRIVMLTIFIIWLFCF